MKPFKILFSFSLPVVLFSCASQATTKIEFTTSINDWYYLGTPGTVDYRLAYDYQTTDITKDIADNGTVLGYLHTATGNEWLALPYSSYQGTYIDNLNYSYEEGHIYLISKRSDLGNPSWWPGPFKFLIVPPQKMDELNGVNLNNLHEVEAALK